MATPVSKARRQSAPLLARIVAVTVAILAAPGLFQGCSGCTCEECFGSGVDREVRRTAAKSYVYTAPIGDTERELRQLLTSEGFVPEGGAATRSGTLRAPRRANERDEIRAEFSPVGKDRYKIEIWQLTQYIQADGGLGQVNKRRELDLEYRLALQMDPIWAAKTNEEAERKMERARSVGRGCDRGCELGCRACRACDERLK